MGGIVFLLAGVLILAWFRRRVAATALFGGVLVLWGAAFVSQMGSSADAAVRSKGAARIPVTVVQPNVGQEDTWEGSKADANFAKLARLPTPRDDAPRLILWPAAAVPAHPERATPSVYLDQSERA